jgi:hypothetical protein
VICSGTCVAQFGSHNAKAAKSLFTVKTFLFEGSRKSRKSWLVDLLLLCFLLAIFFGYGLGSRALWSPIEGRYAEIAREMLVSHDYVTLRLAGTKFFDKPPFFYLA